MIESSYYVMLGALETYCFEINDTQCFPSSACCPISFDFMLVNTIWNQRCRTFGVLQEHLHASHKLFLTERWQIDLCPCGEIEN